MAGWQEYATNLEKVGFTGAAILGQGGGVWCKSPTLQLVENAPSLCEQMFANPTSACSMGCFIDGRYMTILQATDDHVYARRGQEGFVIIKTKTAYLICHYDSTLQAGQAAFEAGRMSDHLIKQGY
eukprot:Lithocolla_globosa_v1_NODE_3834_length_1565_cov_4.137384.p1 type:complete len:126 gc:universal NODE_3834_length_1565_cov_4.137384:1237-860(-)